MQGRVCELCVTRKGSQLLQKFLGQNGSQKNVDLIVAEVLGQVAGVMAQRRHRVGKESQLFQRLCAAAPSSIDAP